ncbi:hypothetical protein, partial [Salmonella enterica]|uniref:hypothetical protein n=1 Tax=Salmonella enterica TaxID=28901 RepID=UPI0032971972
HGDAAQFPVSPVSPLYPADLEQDYSLESLSTALRESGYTGGRSLTLLVNAENSFKAAVATHLAESFTAAGIPMAVR